MRYSGRGKYFSNHDAECREQTLAVELELENASSLNALSDHRGKPRNKTAETGKVRAA